MPFPSESPVIPTGWIYRLAGGKTLSEYRLWCRQQSRQFTLAELNELHIEPVGD